ncbi:MAG: hypothetical protein P8I91_08555 [Phycisphaerales bacterium]|nr:hypothetical protein [Phycisphaerales bacterium]
MHQTIIEQIATAHAVGLSKPVYAGDYLRIRPKHIMTHDNSSAVMGKFSAIGATAIFDAAQPSHDYAH